jgi:hypothetical protein
MPCPPGTCKDVASGQCRSFNANREKVNETDTTERESGGGRGYCRKKDGGGGGGGGGGQGGGGGVPGGAAVPGGANAAGSPVGGPLSTEADAASKTIWGELSNILGGKSTRFTPEVMANLDSNAREASIATARGSEDAVRQDALRRGVFQSPQVTSEIGNIERSANSDYSRAANQNRIQKVNADFEDKMGALDRAQKWLDSQRDYIVRLDMTAAQREAALANIRLGYARIAAEERMLRASLQNNIDVAGINNNPLQWILPNLLGGN